MPRQYKHKPGTKVYKKHSDARMEAAVRAIRSGQMSYRKASAKFNIARSVLNRHTLRPETQKHGGPTVLGDQVEALIVRRLQMCANWGFPMDMLDLRLIVKGYLDRQGTTIRRFKNNMPGKEWATSFLRRHRQALAQRLCQNIKRNRASVSAETINKYFDNITSSIQDVPAANIINYDETNLADDPGRKKVLMKRGTRYPERIMNQSKSATSVMYAGAADGTMLPPYVVYKATNMYDTWTFGGPAGTRYNRSKSGWFDLTCFSDWFHKIILPYLKKLPGRKVLIGDNLSSHLSEDVIAACEKYNTAFVFLPPNSTHLCQPLDVCFFRPMKAAWRPIVEKWKKGPGRKQSTISKDTFPQLLKLMTDVISENAAANLKSGFAKCGICPLDRKKVLTRLPETVTTTCDAQNTGASTSMDTVDDSFRSLLHSMRYGDSAVPAKRKKKIDVEPGKSVTGISNTHSTSSHKDTTGTGSSCDSDTISTAGSYADSSESDDNVMDSSADNNSSGSSDDEPLASRISINNHAGTSRETNRADLNNNVTISVTGTHGTGTIEPRYTGIQSVILSDLQVNSWVLVDFADAARKRQLYLGRVEHILPVMGSNPAEFEGIFLRNKSCSDNCFIYPVNEDRTIFTFEQVVGKTAEPELQRRDVLKFDVVASEWK